MSDLMLIKLLNGDELIAEIENPMEVMSPLKIKNPVRVVIIPSRGEPTKPSVTFVPWGEFSQDKEFSLNRQHITCMSRPIAQFVTEHKKLFSNVITRPGLVVPPGA